MANPIHKEGHGIFWAEKADGELVPVTRVFPLEERYTLHLVALRGGGYKYVLRKIREQYREYKVNGEDEARLPEPPAIRRHRVQHKLAPERYPARHRSHRELNGGCAS